MLIERIPLMDDDEVTLFWYEPVDLSLRTHVFCWWKGGNDCGPCAGISLIFLNNSVDDINMGFSSIRFGANDAPMVEDEVAYADRHIKAFYDGLRDLEARNGGSLTGASGDEVKALMSELDEHVFWSPAGNRFAGAGLEGLGTVVDYLADDGNQNQMLAMLALYCEDTDWQGTPGPKPAVVRSRLEGKQALVIPGDEDLVTLAINLYNRGAYEECPVVDVE